MLPRRHFVGISALCNPGTSRLRPADDSGHRGYLLEILSYPERAVPTNGLPGAPPYTGSAYEVSSATRVGPSEVAAARASIACQAWARSESACPWPELRKRSRGAGLYFSACAPHKASVARVNLLVTRGGIDPESLNLIVEPFAREVQTAGRGELDAIAFLEGVEDQMPL